MEIWNRYYITRPSTRTSWVYSVVYNQNEAKNSRHLRQSSIDIRLLWHVGIIEFCQRGGTADMGSSELTDIA